MVKEGYVPDRGDLIWIDFNPTRGHEQNGKRPALVLSPKSYNERIGMALLCPVTSVVKDYPFEVAIKSSKIEGVVLSDQIRSVDWTKRRIKKIERVHAEIFEEVKRRILAILQ